MKPGLISTPLYNFLIIILAFVPGGNAGLAVIILTLIIRLILFPLSKKSIKTQLQMRQIEPDLKKIRETYKDRQEQATKTMQLYKEREINPFAGLLLALIQIPILFSLYRVFYGGFGTINTSMLYGFVHAPAHISMLFLGIDLSHKSIVLAVIAVITQFIQLNISLPSSKKIEQAEKSPSFQNDLARSMNMQMKYIFPLIMFPIAYISAVLALYFVTSNIFMIFQELFVRRKLAAKYHIKLS
jgi:YidC/Oxa1 family membrane protein insertase